MSTKTRTQVELAADTSMERLVASQLSRVLVLVPPWVLVLLAVIATAVFHWAWGSSTLAALGIGAAGLGLAVLVYAVSHQRGRLGRLHATGTAAAVALWVATATVDGVNRPIPLYLATIGGISLALSWNVRHVIRGRGQQGDGDHLAAAFADASGKAGLGGSRLQIRSRSARVIEGTIALPPGEATADDAVKRTARLESGLKFPPGALSIAADPDRADRALVRVSDPRTMRKAIPWPGPSQPGKSVALPLQPGIWQDSAPVEYAITNHHLQLNGCTGSGKSVGGGWSLLADLVTRTDVAVVAADLTKGEQSFGCLRPALHKLVTTKEGARSLLDSVHAVIRPRTDFLAERGLQLWKEGCGLVYLVCWLEEAPDCIDSLTDAGRDRWLSSMKAARSAGITFVLSLQRSDWSQIPTLARGQMAKWCFGLMDSSDAAFGLTEIQAERGARPELWGSRQPGMAYLDAPGIPDERLAMPMRTWFFGQDDSLIAEHAAKWPASARPLDSLTAAVLGGGVQIATIADLGADDDDQDDDDDLVRQIAPPEDETDVAEPAEIKVPDTEFGKWTFAKPPAEKADPAEARQALADLIGGWRDNGRKSFVIADLAEFRATVGLSRPWLYKVLTEMDGDLIERDDAGWLIARMAARAGREQAS